MKPLMEFKQVGYSYTEKAKDESGVVHDLTFSINEGEFVAIIGGNGAGKTTTSKLMNGLLKPTKGTVLVQGVPTDNALTSKLAHKVGMLFQDPDKQICKNTVYEELAFGLQLRGFAEEEISRRVKDTLEDFNLSGDKAPFMLSRGERQVLALASIVVCQPEVLILDEPTTGLDYRECMHIMERVKQLNAAGTTVIMISHDMEVVLDFADRVIAMAKGRIIADGVPEAIFRDEHTMREASLLPPMMIDLSLRLSKNLKNEALASVSSVDEMVRVVQALQTAKFTRNEGE